MKLIICPHCFDVFRPTFEPRTCLCGRSHGRVQANSVDIVTEGMASIMQLDMWSLTQALIVHAPDVTIPARIHHL